MTDFLSTIAELTRARVIAEKQQVPLEDLIARVKKAPRKHGRFAAALRPAKGLAVIAELKQASPSAGVIRLENDIAGRIQQYTQGGAAALSILTEEKYFNGSTHLLELARHETKQPLLRKDFILDVYQVYESCLLGADALLLIVAMLKDNELKALYDLAHTVGLDALVEVHDERELERALILGVDIIGINNRNLHTLKVDLGTAAKMLPQLDGRGKTVVVESGIRTVDDARRYRELGAHAVLIGETLMRSDDPGQLIKQFVSS